MLPQHLQESLHALNIKVPVCNTVLLVDDEQENLDVLAALLEEDWEVYTALNGEQALGVVERRGPVDLVIADQRMPGMTGVTLLTRIAELNPDTVRIVLTAYSDVEPMLEAINIGSVYRFLLKPFDSTEIRSIVKDALQLKASTEALRRMVNALIQRREAMDKNLSKLDATQQKLITAERKATLGRVTSGIVHDLGNLASSLTFLMDSLRQATNDPEPLACAERACASLDSLLEMLSQIQDLAHSTAVEVKRQPESTELLLEDIVRLFSMEGLGEDTAVQVTVDPAVARVSADRALLRQAVVALLRNAARSGQQPSQVELVAAPEGQTTLLLEVHDHGCGMDAETLERAAEPFFSGFSPPGPGLGLEIARLNAEAHGGTLALDSTAGVGTTAVIRLPTAVIR